MWLLYEDFIYLLRERFRCWPWWIHPSGEIRSEDAEGDELDPITAMLASVHHRFVDVGSYRIAARCLGLDTDSADAIAQASDLAGSYNAHVRADLIDALRLEEMWGRQGRWGDRAFTDPPYPHQYDRPFRRGSGSGGFASAAVWRARSKYIPNVRKPVWRWQPIANIGAPGVAVSISSGCVVPPPATCSAFSVGISHPGFELYTARVAAD